MVGKRQLPAALAAAALATTLTLGCSSGATAPEEAKRESYFEVVGYYAAPGKGTADMTYAGGYIWLADEDADGMIYKIEPASGSVVSAAGTSYGPPSAICNDGVYIYAAAADTGVVCRHRLSPRLEELAYFPTGLSQVRGMFYDAGTFYVFDQATSAVYEFDDDWARLRWTRVGAGEEWLRGMERAGNRTWSADWRGGWLNRHRRAGFDIDRKFCTPGWHPAGLAWDGNYLYLGDTGARRVYKLDIATAP
jgi:DNA-binding beta-propeller fold protein YncE